MFYDSYNRGYTTDELEGATKLSDFALRISTDKLKEKFGTGLADDFSQILFNCESPNQRNFYLFKLMSEKTMTSEESRIIEKLLSFFSNDVRKNNIVGMHITGYPIGEQLSKEGILLTGHKYVANNMDKNMKHKLEKNITFYNNPIDFITSFINNRGYNNYDKSSVNDIMIVSIPKEEFQNKDSDVIIEKTQDEIENKYVNPKYINGFVRVGKERGEITHYIQNTKNMEQLDRNKSKKTIERNEGQGFERD